MQVEVEVRDYKEAKETLGGCRYTYYLDCLGMLLILIVMMASQSIYMPKIIQLCYKYVQFIVCQL